MIQQDAIRRVLLAGAFVSAAAVAAPFHFSTGDPNGLMAVASRTGAAPEIEAADDFIIATPTDLTNATFTGLLPIGVATSSIDQVVVEIYRVFPTDSNNPPSGSVPTRVNSPSDVAFASRDSAASQLTFSASLVSPNFTTNNSVLNGIHSIPNQTTGGEGPVTGQEVTISVTFLGPISLPADHYFFVPQVHLSTGQFFWLTAPKPIVAPGTPFLPDLQSWVRDENLAPNWLRVGTDIVGGTTPPTFNQTFTLDGVDTPVPAFDPQVPTLSLTGLAVMGGLLVVAAWITSRRQRRA